MDLDRVAADVAAVSSTAADRSARGVEQALARATSALRAMQRKDGSWDCDTDIGPVGLASQLVVEHLYGLPRKDSAESIARYFAHWQLSDGAFPPHPHAEHGSVTTTALAWAALVSSGLGETPSACDARRYVDAQGGMVAVGRALRERGDIAALYLVALGMADANVLPPVPPGLALAPLGTVLERRVHAGNVLVMLVLAAVAERHGANPGRGFLHAARRAVEQATVRERLLRWQNLDGSWNGSPLQTTFMLLGLHAAGATLSDPPIQRAFAWLGQMKRTIEGRLDVCAMANDVWSTALSAMALHAAGEPADGEPLARARDHLLATQCRSPMPRENQRKRGALKVGGWPFQRGNETMPDTDDTGVVIATLAKLAGERAPRAVYAAIDAGVAWLRDMQNPDGGFPTFVWGLPSKKPGPLFLRDLAISLEDPRVVLESFLHPPPELGDPSLEGVTGRVLWGLGQSGIGRDDPMVCRAIDFLREQQCDSGAWWGRWKVAYLAETATILLGLAAVGEDMSAEYVRRALRWVLSCQNADGGFGELPDAYRDPQLAGRGPSMPPVTAYVLLGCIATGQASRPQLRRAVDYLLATQDERGLWDGAGWLHTFIPPDLLYTYPLTAEVLPILALAEYTQWTRA